MSEEKRHGTYGFGQYCTDGPDGKHCDECKAAVSEYMRNYRATHPRTYANQRKQQQLRDKALRILASRYPQELKNIISELEGKQ